MDNILVYRDLLLAKSEAFIPRHYSGFAELKPFYVGSYLNNNPSDANVDAVCVSANKFMNILYKQLGYTSRLNLISDKKPKLIHAHFGRGGALAMPLAEKLHVPLVVTFHGGDATKEKHYRVGVVKTIYQRRLNRLKNTADIFLCVSDYIKSVLVRRGFPRLKLITHYIGIELPDLMPQVTSKKDRNKEVLFVGRMVEKKGLDDLIDAMSIVQKKHKDISLKIIGDGVDSDYYKEMVERKKLKKCEFLGWLPPSDVKQHMASSLMLSVPSKTAKTGDSEGLPTVVMESLLVGTPVVSTYHAGIPEIIENGKEGLLGKEGDVEQLANNILTIYDMKIKDYKNMQELGLKKLYDKFNAKTQSQKLEKIFAKLIKQAESRNK